MNHGIPNRDRLAAQDHEDAKITFHVLRAPAPRRALTFADCLQNELDRMEAGFRRPLRPGEAHTAVERVNARNHTPEDTESALAQQTLEGKNP